MGLKTVDSGLNMDCGLGNMGEILLERLSMGMVNGLEWLREMRVDCFEKTGCSQCEGAVG